jgi:hypothetical protein
MRKNFSLKISLGIESFIKKEVVKIKKSNKRLK